MFVVIASLIHEMLCAFGRHKGNPAFDNLSVNEKSNENNVDQSY